MDEKHTKSWSYHQLDSSTPNQFEVVDGSGSRVAIVDGESTAKLVAACPVMVNALNTLHNAERFAAESGVTTDDHMRRTDRVRIQREALRLALPESMHANIDR
jgi:hypothetical protein